MHDPKPLGGRFWSVSTILLALLALAAIWILAQRFMYGLGAVTHLSNGYPWGIWVVYDVVIATGFACGGYVLAFMVYVANRGHYHPLVRPALLASLLGYGLGAASAFFDMGRYWNAPNMLLPWYHNYNSVMLEVGLCVMAYVLVLAIEFMPVVFERFGLKAQRRLLEKALFFFIALGVVLPTMHQSSLGSLLIALGSKVDPLWQAYELMPVLALASAVVMGFSIVLFEGSFSSLGFKRPSETPLLATFARPIVWLLSAWLAVRFGELALRGKLAETLVLDFRGLMFWVEISLFVVPLVVLSSARRRARGDLLLLGAVSMLLAGAVYRVNAFLIGFNPRPGYVYFPSVEELLVTVGLVALEILVFIFFVKRFPVLPAAEASR